MHNAVRKELREEEKMKNKPQNQRTVMSHVEVNSVEQRMINTPNNSK